MERDIDREVGRVDERVRETSERAAERFSRMGGVSGRAESADGAVRVEVAPGGLLTEVRLSHAALRSGSDVLARQITDLAHRATRRAGDRMYRALSPVLGPDGDRRLAALGYEPLPDDDADAADDHDAGDVTAVFRGR